jgi:branched-chain amino acid aminotransferase
MISIEINKSSQLKEIPNPENLGFGTIFTDHMFMMDYTQDQGWHNAKIVPYGPIEFDPSMMVLHYGQETFEGLKAYKGNDGEIFLFRPEYNGQRLNDSNKRLCIPEIPIEDFIKSIEALVKIDRRWIPEGIGTALYIRPFVFATDASLKVHPAKTYKYMVILSPVGAYYTEGLNPVKIQVEEEYVRASVGGVGFAKTGGNYGAGLLAQEKAAQNGCSQVLWLDSKEHRYVEEVGTMNVFFVKEGTLITPALSGSILPGITRDSVIKIAEKLGIPVEERKIDIHEIIEASEAGQITEAFGTGTAAVISPVGTLVYQGKEYCFNHHRIGEISQKLYDLVTGIQLGEIEDLYGFRHIIR